MSTGQGTIPADSPTSKIQSELSKIHGHTTPCTDGGVAEAQSKGESTPAGFTTGGVRSGSTAAAIQAAYGGHVPKGSEFSKLQSAAAKGQI